MIGKYFFLKNSYKLIGLSNLVLFLHGSDSKPKVLNYRDVFDPLVQAVLENDYKKVCLGLRRGSCDPHQLLTNLYNLRHIAQSRKIDLLLLNCHQVGGRKHRFGVAPRNPILIATVAPEEVDGYTDAEILRYTAYVSRHTKIERDPDHKDIYGKYPEDYTYKQRAENAANLRKSFYSNIDEK